MNRKQLIKTLLQNDLNKFRYSIWATYNEQGELQFEICLRGSKPEGYEIHLCSIGGAPCVDYNYEYLEFVIDDSLDEFYDKTGTIL